MSNKKQSKINRLISQWPRGTVGAASYLNSLGFSHNLLTRYKKSGWLQSSGRGAYILFGDKIGWPGALYALQTQLGLTIHAGGKTALEVKGYAHYLPTKQERIFLYGPRGLAWPKWFNGERINASIVMVRTNLFPETSQQGFSELKEEYFSVKISSPERAAMEMLHLVPGKVGFEEADLIMENLVGLRSTIVQGLLESCKSIKVKRLFMYMAEKHDHAWVPQLTLSKVDFGGGKRMIVSRGKYDRKYLITVPRDHKEGSG